MSYLEMDFRPAGSGVRFAHVSRLTMAQKAHTGPPVHGRCSHPSGDGQSRRKVARAGGR